MSSVFLLPPEDRRLLPDHEDLHGVSIRKAKNILINYLSAVVFFDSFVIKSGS
jgi:hypothetical protein